MSGPQQILVAVIVTAGLATGALGQQSQPSSGPVAVNLFVATDGRDVNPGTVDKPFASLERARDQIRSLKKSGGLPKGPVVVALRGGTYQRQRCFDLSAEDSGVADAPVVYRAYAGEQVRLLGGRFVPEFKPVTDPAILERLDEAARGKVLQADLRALGISDFGEVKGGGLELFFQDKPMTLARWPNEGFVKIVDVLPGKPVNVRGTKGDQIGKFSYDGDRPKRWAGEQEVWLHGYWFWDWADQRQKVESIDTERRIISLAKPYHSYGYRKGQWYYAFNVLAELDSPGEWYLDRKTGILYFWPPAAVGSGQATVSVIPSLANMKDVAHVSLCGMTLEACRGTAVDIIGGEHDRIAGCTIRNAGGWAVRVSGGLGHGVAGCDIYQSGEGGISLEGGDRKTLTPAEHFADNNHIHHYSRWTRMYQPAVSLAGVGNRATHNLMHDAPHEAIAFSGNDQLIEFNEIHDVCTESNDAGAIYAGRDWSMRGTVIRHNYLHHITGFQKRGCVGVYLDDMFCGTLISGNVFYQVTQAAFIGGGRDNVVENNMFVDCKPAVHLDARAQGWAAYSVDTTMKPRLAAMPYQQPPWSQRYPELVKILDDQPAAPKGNRVARNICVGGQWLESDKGTEKLTAFEHNLTAGEAGPLGGPKGLVAPDKGDFRLKDDSPAIKAGFAPIPVDKIGLYKDENRTSLPEKSN